LGVASIGARSPQAKGRIERLWKTLQDRLIAEMSMAGVSSIDEANAFLPGYITRFNQRFGREPADHESAWGELEAEMDLDYYFATSESRVVRKDHTISWYGKAYQLLEEDGCKVTAGKRIDVRTTPEGCMNLYDGRHRLAYRQIETPRPTAQNVRQQMQPKAADPEAEARRRGWLFCSSAA
jgi:hypothetical protein